MADPEKRRGPTPPDPETKGGGHDLRDLPQALHRFLELFNARAQAPDDSSRRFYETLQRLELDVTTIVGIHGNPVPMAQFVEFASRGR